MSFDQKKTENLIGCIQCIIDYTLHIDAHLVELVSQCGIQVCGILFYETAIVVTLLLLGDSLLFVADMLASLLSGNLNIHAMVALTAIAAPGSKVFRFIYLGKTHDFCEKHEGKMITFARFVPIVCTVALFVVGLRHARN